MKFSTQEEYGLRCLLHVSREKGDKGLTIPEISKAEGITTHNTAKILRALRLGGFLASSRGQIGGYTLSRPADEILVKDVLDSLGGKLFDDEFCNDYSGLLNICTHTIDCSVRSLWQMLQGAVDGVLRNMTIKDLISTELNSTEKPVLKTSQRESVPSGENESGKPFLNERILITQITNFGKTETIPEGTKKL